MALNKKTGSVLKSRYKYIAFPVRTNGLLDSFAQKIRELGFKELSQLTDQDLGNVITKEINGRIFHALPVISSHKEGWGSTSLILERCLNSDDIHPKKPVALMLRSIIDDEAKACGAKTNLIIEVIKETKRNIVLFMK